MNLFITIDGTQSGSTVTSTITGDGHFLAMPIQCSLLNASAGTHTILLKGYASSTAIITANNVQLNAIGNLA